MQHFSDCDGSAIFRVASKNVGICINSYQNRTLLDLFQTSSLGASLAPSPALCRAVHSKGVRSPVSTSSTGGTSSTSSTSSTIGTSSISSISSTSSTTIITSTTSATGGKSLNKFPGRGLPPKVS
jgi:hypothetical protein